ncbi:MAG: VWA domain-containing protein [Acidobacteria bacterium]|nr:VWA domain-containing protein [Acidobacteriota bacterium]
MGSTRFGVRASLVLLCSVLIGAALAAQQEATFKGGIRTVAVYATVTSANGRLVTDAPREAFSIYDNNKKQELTLFASDIQPITVVILLDRSGSMVGNFQLVEEAAEQFVAVMLPQDKARIGSFSNRIQVDPMDFTSNHEELLKILRTDLQEEGPTPLWNAVNVGITDLLHQQGRRVVLVFTDGMDAPMNFRNGNSSLKDVMKRAEEEDVMIYAIGLASSMPSRVRAPGGGGGYPGGGVPGGRGGGFPGGRGGGGFPGGRGGGFGGGRPGGVSDHPDEGLPKLAAATGGGYFELTSTADLTSTFQRVANELHHQYALGFTPTNLDNKMHALEVKLEAQGATVRARRSYLARNER